MEGTGALSEFLSLGNIITLVGCTCTVVLISMMASKRQSEHREKIYNRLRDVELAQQRFITMRHLDQMESSLKSYISERVSEHERMESEIHGRIDDKLEHIRSLLNGREQSRSH